MSIACIPPSPSRFFSALGALAFVAGCSGALSDAATASRTAPSTDSAVELDAGLPFVPVGVETVAATTVEAGRLLPISCLPVDENGDLYGGVHGLSAEIRSDRVDALVEQSDGAYMAQKAGKTQVYCVIPSLDLVDDSPSTVTIAAGDPALVSTTLDDDSTIAGSEVQVTCRGEDRFGNAISDLETQVLVTPQADGTTVDQGRLRIEQAQNYEVVCEHPRAKTTAAPLSVEPDAPDSMQLVALPPLPAHYPGDVLSVQANVADRFGNAIKGIDIEYATNTTSGVERPERDAFRFTDEGTHRITGTIAGLGPDRADLTTSLDVVIDGAPPAIRCEHPRDGLTMEAPTNAEIAFRGAVSDNLGVEKVTVNGQAVDLADGEFRHTLTTDYGVNYALIEATDSAARTSSRLCAFITAPKWLGAVRATPDTVSLRLPAAAFDDGDRTDDIDSLTDLLDAALRSPALRDTVHGQLSGNPVLKPSACDESILGGCILRTEIRYEDVQIMGEPTIALSLIADGLATDVRLRGLRLNVRARGHVAGIDFDSRGTVTIKEIRAQAEFDTTLSAGKPKIALRSGSVSTSASGVDTDFKGTDGAVIDLVGDLFNGSVRGLIADAVRGVITDQVADVLSSSLGSLDLTQLSTTLEITKPLSDESVAADLSLSFSSLETTDNRMLLGLGTQVSAQNSRRFPSLGTPTRGQPAPNEGTSKTATVLAVHEALANQIVSALWQAGLFELELNGKQIDGIPNALSGEVSVGMPPLVELIDGRARLSAGAIHAEVVHPDIAGGAVIQLQVGARVSARMGMDGQALQLDDFKLDMINFSADPDLGFGATEDFQQYLSQLFERMLSPVLEDAFPALVIPGLMLPDGAADFSIPDMASLGLLKPALAIVPPHATLSGQFGLR